MSVPTKLASGGQRQWELSKHKKGLKMKNDTNRLDEKSRQYPSPFSRLLLIPHGSTLSVEDDLTGAVGVCKNATLVCGGSCFINVDIGENAKFLCRGACFGNVVINEGGFFKCDGAMRGNIINHGGRYEIGGEFSGRVSEVSTNGKADAGDDGDDYDIDEDN